MLSHNKMCINVFCDFLLKLAIYFNESKNPLRNRYQIIMAIITMFKTITFVRKINNNNNISTLLNLIL